MSLLEASPSEQRILQAAGEMVDLREGRPGADDPAHGGDWGAGRTVRAEFLREILSGARDLSCGPGVRPVRLRGARIMGVLDLEGVELTRSVLLQDCCFDKPVNLCEARALAIRLPGCHLPSLQARQLEVRGDLILNDGLTAASINVVGAAISGVLSLNGAILNNPSGTTLQGNALTVGQYMSCCNGFVSWGKIMLIGAEINGLAFTGARLENKTGWALDAQGMSVSYALHLGSSIGNEAGFSAEGGLRLVGVHVDGFVSGRSAHIRAREGGRYAVAALGLQVSQSLLFERFTADGEVDLTGAEVGDEIDFDGATFRNPGGQALTASRLTVGDSLLCTGGFTAEGVVSVADSKIGGSLDFTGASLSDPEGSSLNLQGLTTRTLVLKPAAQAARVDLRRASTNVLDDDPSTWPAQLWLRNFTYDSIEHDPSVGIAMRLGWLRRDPEGYLPQPYEQLNSACRLAGQEEAARAVAIAKQRARRQVLNPAGKIWNWLLDLTIGYGYRTWQAGLWLIALTLIGTVVFASAYPADMIAIRHPPMTFSAPVYTLDVLLPIIDLGQQSSWQPTGVTLYFYWALIVLGWTLTTALVAGLTGIFKRD